MNVKVFTAVFCIIFYMAEHTYAWKTIIFWHISFFFYKSLAFPGGHRTELHQMIDSESD